VTPSQHSLRKSSDATHDSAPAEVSAAFVAKVIKDWEELVTTQLNMDISSLVVATSWKYQEALEYLCYCVLEALGVAMPTNAAFSLIGTDPDDPSWSTCELVLVWSAATSLMPGDILDDCVATRVTPFPLPPQHVFVSKEAIRHRTVARWARQLSEIADDLPKKET